MKYLSKVWVRVLVSLIGGGMTQEIVFLSTGDATRPRENEGSGITMGASIMIFIILTFLASYYLKKRVDKL